MDCLRCGSPMQYKGTDQIQLGKTGFVFGTLSNLLSGALDAAIFECPKCGKIEFFNPEIAEAPGGDVMAPLGDLGPGRRGPGAGHGSPKADEKRSITET